MTLTEWIKNPSDITTGRNLYKENCTNAALYKVLCCRDSPGILKLLFNELSQVAAVKFVQENAKLQKQVDSITELSPELKALEQERIKLYKITEQYKFELGACENKDRRCELAHAILDNFDKINEMWGKIDYFQANK